MHEIFLIPETTKKGSDPDCLDCLVPLGGVGVNDTNYAKLVFGLLDQSLTQEELNWLSQHQDVAQQIYTYLYENNNSEEAINFAKEAVGVLSESMLSPNLLLEDYTNAILKMTSHLKQWGNPEDEIFAEYIELIVPDFVSMTRGDVFDIYTLVRNQVHQLTFKYLISIVTPFAEAAYPFIMYAVTEATLAATLPLLSKIPLRMVSRGVRLDKMVKEVARLGTAGKAGSHIRIIPNSSNAKALHLFNKLTQNSLSITTETLSNGRYRKIANMGNGNYITFRNYDYSNTPNLVANIDLNFPSIWSKIRELKFVK